jgi:hypothetical protein
MPDLAAMPRYMMDSGLAVLSTTNHFFNTSAYSALTPQSLVCPPC